MELFGLLGFNSDFVWFEVDEFLVSLQAWLYWHPLIFPGFRRALGT